MGTGVTIGAGIFALTGQIAQLAGPYFALPLVIGTIITSFRAYSSVMMSNDWPSSGADGDLCATVPGAKRYRGNLK